MRISITIAALQLLVALIELLRNRKWPRRCGGGWTSSRIGVTANRTLVAKHHNKAGGCPSLYDECLRTLTTKPKKLAGQGTSSQMRPRRAGTDCPNCDPNSSSPIVPSRR
jgi:hypothetical protein